MSKFKKGHKGYWLGKKRPSLSKETKDRISQTLMNHSVSEETKNKITKKSIFQKGHIPWNKDKVQSEETKDKIRQTNKRKGIEPKVKFVEFGVNHPRWKGGCQSENNRIRGRIEFRLWREAIFARDNWTCQKYGIKGGTLHPHHIKNFAQYPELRFAIDNGITLSEKAHREFHKEYGTKDNNKKQLEEYLNNYEKRTLCIIKT